MGFLVSSPAYIVLLLPDYLAWLLQQLAEQ
jgi:hypothetical protein